MARRVGVRDVRGRKRIAGGAGTADQRLCFGGVHGFAPLCRTNEITPAAAMKAAAAAASPAKAKMRPGTTSRARRAKYSLSLMRLPLRQSIEAHRGKTAKRA